jgi:K+/H+ antiporter YhaU regulatory subunit KhtT
MKNIEVLEKCVDENQEMTEEDWVLLSEVLYNLPYVVRGLVARNKTIEWLEKELHKCKDFLNYLETRATGTLEGLRTNVFRKKEEIDTLEWILSQLSTETEEFKRQNSSPNELTKEVLKVRKELGFLPGEWK